MTVTLGLKSGQQWVLGARLQTPQIWWGEGRTPSHPGPACESAELPQASAPAPACSQASSFPPFSRHPWCHPAVWVEWRVGSPLGPPVLFQTRLSCCLLPDGQREGAGLAQGWAFSLIQLGGDPK